MRVLCLHPSTSSASQLHTSLSTLEERLWTKHGIELVFIDAPLLDVRLGGAVGVPDGGLTALRLNEDGGDEVEENGGSSSRRWYVEEEVGLDGKKRSAVLPPAADDDSVGTVTNKQPQVNTNDTNHANTNNKSTTVQYSGLDASLLHLSQIWSRGGANHNNADNKNGSSGGIEQCLPFQGIMGIQQGANVAAMLPLLNTANVVYENEEEEGGKENWKSIFEGLQFVILVDGVDIMSQDEQQKEGEEDEGKDEINKECDNNTGNDEEEGDDWYVDPNGISSLHVIAETTSKDGNVAAATNKSKSELLAKRYGPNATIQYYKPTKTNISSSSTSSQSNTTKNTNITQQQQYKHNHLNSPSLHNILGKYLVHQKNTLHTNPQKRKLLQLQHQLCHVEQLASVMITEEVRRNPPKCLMAMIGPAASASEGDSCEKENGEDETEATTNSKKNEESTTTTTNENVKAVVGKTVGAWQGPGRVPGEQGGGAPCPETFLLRQEERRRNDGLVVSHDVIVADET